MDDLGVILNNTNIGCTINNNNYNYIRYADDVCLLSMSSAGMPKLFNICEDCGGDHDLIYNSTTSISTCIKIYNNKMKDPLFKLNNTQLPYIEEAKYIGVYIYKDGTDRDVKRQIKKLYPNINMLLRQFHYCSCDVKYHLVKNVCSSNRQYVLLLVLV